MPEGQETAVTLQDYLAALRMDTAGEGDKIAGLRMVAAVSPADKNSPVLKADPKKHDLMQALQGAIEDLDAQIGVQLDAILHDEAFQKLEATWRGLHYLVFNTETSSRLKLRVLDVKKSELEADLFKAVEFDQSGLFKKVYEEEYGTLGGKPYGLLVGDYYFNRDTPSLNLLGKIAEVAAAAHAPFVAGTAAGMFDLESFVDLPKPRDLSKIFEAVDMAEWASLREREESRYVALTLPRVLFRLPYDPVDNPVEGLDYTEQTGVRAPADRTTGPNWLEPDHGKYLWGNPAWVFAQRITNAFALHSWTAAIRGVEGGGKVADLPVSKFITKSGEKAIIIPTEVSITDRREKELSDLGFISLVNCKDTNYAAFFGAQTVNKPKRYNLASANNNSELSARLPYILNTSRFAHYIKVMMRDRIGQFMSKENVQAYLTTWISDYVLDKDDAGQDLKAKYPLREARVDVIDVPGQPGAYSATVFLRPHFQLEGLSASLRLVAQLPPPTA